MYQGKPPMVLMFIDSTGSEVDTPEEVDYAVGRAIESMLPPNTPLCAIKGMLIVLPSGRYKLLWSELHVEGGYIRQVV